MSQNSLTIQAELEKAFYLSSLVSPANYGYPKKCGWSNSARTDKGVHAAAQVISARVNVPTPSEDLDDLRDLVNGRLPPDIRVLDVKKVTKAFCAKTARDKVRYQYMVPTYCLRGDLGEAMDGILGGKEGGGMRGSFESLDEGTKDKLQREMTAYRTDAKVLEKVRGERGGWEGKTREQKETALICLAYSFVEGLGLVICGRRGWDTIRGHTVWDIRSSLRSSAPRSARLLSPTLTST